MFYLPRRYRSFIVFADADTVRALLIPQAATRSMFGPNDSISESDIRKVNGSSRGG